MTETTGWDDLRRRLWNASLLLEGARNGNADSFIGAMCHDGVDAVREAHGLLGAIAEDGAQEHVAAAELRSELARARLRIAELEKSQ